jgi:antitoxin YefM
MSLDVTIHEVSARRFSENLEQEVEKVVSNHEILRVRRDGGDIVVLSADDWRSVEETLYLKKVPGLVESIHEAAREPREKRSSAVGRLAAGGRIIPARLDLLELGPPPEVPREMTLSEALDAQRRDE